jgi:hypothetical protein
MKKQPTQPTEEARRLDQLVAHPHQQAFFEDLLEHELNDLAADIKRNGLREKIQILPRNKAGLPPNTILDGNQRRRALLLNGERTSTVVVRYDLAAADAATVERVFLEFNTNRRQLDALGKARVALRLLEIEEGRKFNLYNEDEARDRVGKVIGMSGRNLQRYWRVLQTPVEVQNALRAKEIRLVDAARVANLSDAERAEVAERIRAREAPREVLADYLQGNGRHRSGSGLGSFVRGLRRGMDKLDGRVKSSVSPWDVAFCREDLERAQRLITRLLALDAEEE